MTGLAELLELVEAGEVLVPLTFAKRPIIRWKDEPMPPGRISAYADVAEMWARVIPQGVVVLDLDDGQPPPSDWPSTRTWKTPRGYHLAFESWASFSKRPVQVDGRKVDVMPAGTLQVLLGPGRELVWNWPPVPLPDELEEALTGRPAAPPSEAQGGWDFPYGAPARAWHCPPGVRDEEAYKRKVAINLPSRMRKTAPGNRNATLNRTAFEMALLGPSASAAAWALLRKEALRTGLGSEEVDKTIASARAAVG